MPRVKVFSVFVLMMLAQPAPAGTVSFYHYDPLPVGPYAIDIEPGQSALLTVLVGTASGPFDAVSLLIGSDRPGLDMSFVYNFQPLPPTLPPPPPAHFGIWPSDLFVGGNRFATPLWTAPLQLGTLIIDTSNAVLYPPGTTFDVFVSADREEQTFGTAISSVALGASTPEPLNGSIRINLVPEPGTLLLLAFGSLLFARRPRPCRMPQPK